MTDPDPVAAALVTLRSYIEAGLIAITYSDAINAHDTLAAEVRRLREERDTFYFGLRCGAWARREP